MRARSALVLTFALVVCALVGCNRINSSQPANGDQPGPDGSGASAKDDRSPDVGPGALHARRTAGAAAGPARRAASRSSSRTATCSTRTGSKCRPRSRARSRSSPARSRSAPMAATSGSSPARSRSSTTRPSRTRASSSTRATRTVPEQPGEVGSVLEARRERLRRGRSGPVPARRPDDRRPRRRPPRRSARRRSRCESYAEDGVEIRPRRRSSLYEGQPRRSSRESQQARRPDHPQPLPREPGPGQPGDRQGRAGRGGGRVDASRKHQIRSRVDGIIRSVAKRPGEYVRPGEKIFEIQSTEKVRLEGRSTRSTPTACSRNMVVTVEPAVPSAPVGLTAGPSAGGRRGRGDRPRGPAADRLRGARRLRSWSGTRTSRERRTAPSISHNLPHPVPVRVVACTPPEREGHPRRHRRQRRQDPHLGPDRPDQAADRARSTTRPTSTPRA